MTRNDKIEMADVTVDVIIDRKVAFGTVGMTPFRARLGNTSPYLGHGKSIWEVNDEFSPAQRRVIARAIWKAMDDEKAVRMSKMWTHKDGYWKVQRTADVLLPGRK